MKKRVLSGLMVGMMIIGNGVCAFATEDVTNTNDSSALLNTVSQVVEVLGHEGTVNLDSYMQGKGLNGKEVIYGEKPSLTRGRPSKPNADGGYFWAELGYSNLEAYFEHSYKTHRVTLTNWNGEFPSDWAAPGDLAYKTIKASLTGNKANWKTK